MNGVTTPNLPRPDRAALEVSERLTAAIEHAVDAAGGFLGFDRYMALALYAPGLGYYVNGTEKFGPGGDFVTAPDLSPLFGACLARQCRQVLERSDDVIVEFGGGSGRLAVSLLRQLERDGALPSRYFVVELSPELRARQQALFEREAPELLAQVEWLAAPPASPIRGVVIANEILDALPLTCFEYRQDRFLERGAVRSSDGPRAFEWAARPASAALQSRLRERLDPVAWPGGYRSEVCHAIGPWVADLARLLESGVALLIDYGDARGERYHPDRSEGTLRCYYRHHLHDDPWWLPGLSDITASVDFTAVAEAASAADLEVAGFTTQTAFLAALDLDALLATHAGPDPVRQMNLAQQAKMLLLPSEMGTRFKVMALAAGDAPRLSGFGEGGDLRHRL